MASLIVTFDGPPSQSDIDFRVKNDRARFTAYLTDNGVAHEAEAKPRLLRFQALDEGGGKLFSLDLRYVATGVWASFWPTAGSPVKASFVPWGQNAPWLQVHSDFEMAAREDRIRREPPPVDLADTLSRLIERDPEGAAARIAAILDAALDDGKLREIDADVGKAIEAMDDEASQGCPRR